MNVVERAHRTYGQNARPLRSPRRTEYELFGIVSHRLRSAAKNKDTDFPAFAEALHENRRLWSALAVDVAQPENGLPESLRARLFWLSEFTEAETRKILRGTGEVSVLIEVNAAIMQGLREPEVGT